MSLTSNPREGRQDQTAKTAHLGGGGTSPSAGESHVRPPFMSQRFFFTYPVSRSDERLLFGSELVQQVVGHLHTPGPQFSYRQTQRGVIKPLKASTSLQETGVAAATCQTAFRD